MRTDIFLRKLAEQLSQESLHSQVAVRTQDGKLHLITNVSRDIMLDLVLLSSEPVVKTCQSTPIL